VRVTGMLELTLAKAKRCGDGSDLLEVAVAVHAEVVVNFTSLLDGLFISLLDQSGVINVLLVFWKGIFW